ncbi:F-box/LRR-repeat protein 20-like [Drosophila tropicalis]|uniref:F-box/LRR-repeat protein 20-like n=1 Tax=Drosophila tropicalis TaxID=46794 RepID=UPI0035AC0FFD
MDNYSNKNHYVENGLCFTKDHIPVQKLSLYHIPDNVTIDDLHKHFSVFGRVISVQIYEKFKKVSLPEMDNFVVCHNESIESFLPKTIQNTGSVLFASSSDAAKALATKIHHVNEYEIEVLASDSWNQPEPQSSVDSSEEAHIFKIPDDCLLMILKLLPFADQIHFGRVCKRLQTVYALSARTIHKSIDLKIFGNLTFSDIRDFFYYAGPYVEHICGKGLISFIRNELIFSCLGSNCINLKSIRLKNVLISTKTYFETFSNINKLEILALDMCHLTDGDLMAFKNLKCLKELSLCANRITGSNLMKLPNSIEKLNLSCCKDVKSENLISMFETLANLKVLYICKIPTDFPRNARCLSLEKLRTDLNHESQCEDIAKLPLLKGIFICSIAEVDLFNKLFDQLVKHKSEQLEEIAIDPAHALTKQMLIQIAKLSGLKRLTLPDAISIDSVVANELANLSNLEYINLIHCLQLTNSDVLNLLLRCPKLRELHLTYCSKITEQLVNEIIKRMQLWCKKYERKLPICIYGYETNINIQNCSLDGATKDIVKVFMDF